jgi:hypothetical protein
MLHFVGVELDPVRVQAQLLNQLEHIVAGTTSAVEKSTAIGPQMPLDQLQPLAHIEGLRGIASTGLNARVTGAHKPRPCKTGLVQPTAQANAATLAICRLDRGRVRVLRPEVCFPSRTYSRLEKIASEEKPLATAISRFGKRNGGCNCHK